MYLTQTPKQNKNIKKKHISLVSKDNDNREYHHFIDNKYYHETEKMKITNSNESH